MNKPSIDLDLLIELHNKARSNKTWFKKPTLLYKNIKLTSYAQNHADWMSRKNSLTHSNIKDIIDLGFSSVAENIAWGQATAERVMDSWLWSIGHRANIMSFSYDQIGCGISWDKNNRPYWCVVFGKNGDSQKNGERDFF